MIRAFVAFILLSKLAVAESPTSVFLNGGSTATSNLSDQEQDVLAFYHALFDGKATILNAGDRPASGPPEASVPAARTPVVLASGKNFEIERTPDGHVKFGPSALTMQTRAATLTNVRSVFANWKEEKPKAVTIGYGDHGSPEGVMLWNNTTLTPSEIARLHASLPETTWVRSLHSHCYSGVGLVDPQRKKPTKDDDGLTYLRKNYRERSCGFSLSSHHELADSLTREKSWKESPWTKHFDAMRRDKKANLSELKTRLAADPAVESQVRVTSDYVVEDLFDLMCAKNLFENAPATKPPADHGKAAVAHEIDPNSPCGETAKKQAIAKLDAEIDRDTKVFVELMTLRREVALRVVAKAPPGFNEKRYVDRHDQLRETQIRLDELRAKHLVEHEKLTPKQALDLENEMQALLEKLTAFEAELLAVEEGYRRNEEREELWKSAEFRKWLDSEETKAGYPAFRAAWDEPNSGLRRGTLSDVFAEMAQNLIEKKRRIKEASQRLDDSRRKIVESALKRPEFEPMRKFYETIRECEKMPLD